MKYILAAAALGFASVTFAADNKAAVPAAPAASGPAYKEVCRDVKDKGKVCKKIRVHKKLEGKPVPEKK